MRRPPHSVPATLLAAALGLLGTACAGPGGATEAESALPVAVSLPPQAWLVDRLGGARVETAVLLPPGRSHHAFEPAPREIRALGSARLYLAVGHPDLPFESALLASLPAAARPEIVSMTEIVSRTGAAGGPADLSGDPHLWLDPEVMRAAAVATAAALGRLDPVHAGDYEQGLHAVLGEIDAVQRDVERLLAPAHGKTVLVYHPAWGALLRPYGMREEAIEHDGKPPSPRRLAALIEGARRRGVETVFVQPGLPEHAARALAGEIGARQVEIDPLAYDWPGTLRGAAGAFAAAATAPAGELDGDRHR